MKPKNEYFIRAKGKAEFKTYHLINAESFDMLDIFFNSEIEAKEYAAIKSLSVVEYVEKFDAIENGK